MKKTLSLTLLLLTASATHATTTLEQAIYKSDSKRVQQELALIEPLAEQDKAILYELANDILEKRNAKLLINTDVHTAANDLKRFTRSGIVSLIGLGIISGAITTGGLISSIRNSNRSLAGTIMLGGIALGALISLKGIRDFYKSLSLDTAEKKSEYKKLLRNYTNAIIVKQHILKA